MRVKTWICAIALAAVGILAACEAKESSGAAAVEPGQVAEAFYGAYKTLPVGGIPNAEGRAKLEPYVTPALLALLQQADEAEASYARATKGEVPPLVEGDAFTSMFEGASSFAIGACDGDDKARRCVIDLTYEDKSGKTEWHDTADLLSTDATSDESTRSPFVGPRASCVSYGVPSAKWT